MWIGPQQKLYLFACFLHKLVLYICIWDKKVVLDVRPGADIKRKYTVVIYEHLYETMPCI